MITRAFGNTGMDLTKLGVGLAEIGFELSIQQVGQAEEVLNTALDGGINFLDTAACYDVSEELIGLAISTRRGEFYLASKAGHSTGGYTGASWRRQTILDSIDRSLKRLRTDRLDLIQLHSCGLDILENGEVITAIEDAKRAGKVLHIGYSGDNEDAHWAVESGRFETLQTSFNIVDQRAHSSGLLKKAKQRGMGVIVKRPIAGAAWHLSRSGASQSVRGYDNTYFGRAKAMTAHGPIPNEPEDAIAFSMAFLFAHPEVDVAIVGTKSVRHMESNLRLESEGFGISEEAVAELHSRFETLDKDWHQLT